MELTIKTATPFVWAAAVDGARVAAAVRASRKIPVDVESMLKLLVVAGAVGDWAAPGELESVSSVEGVRKPWMMAGNDESRRMSTCRLVCSFISELLYQR